MSLVQLPAVTGVHQGGPQEFRVMIGPHTAPNTRECLHLTRKLESFVDDGAPSDQNDLVLDEEPGHVTWSIPPIICSSRLPTRAVRELLWESPSLPPSVTSSSLQSIRREGNMFDTALETPNVVRKI